MSSNTSEAATTALDQQERDDQTASAEPQSQANSAATPNQGSGAGMAPGQGQEAQQQTATAARQDDDNTAAAAAQPAQGSQSGAAGQQGLSGQGAASGQGIQNISDITGGTDPHADDTARMASEPKPDVSDQDFQELLPKLLNYFHNNREELARAIGIHRSTVDRWLNGKSRPNNSTVLRMRRVVQERRIE
ncbi:MAG: helix-turn-helix domain-containing protein [Blastocatellia bacterium]